MNDKTRIDWFEIAASLSPSWTAERAFIVKSSVVARLRRQKRNQRIGCILLCLLPVVIVAAWMNSDFFPTGSTAVTSVPANTSIPVLSALPDTPPLQIANTMFNYSKTPQRILATPLKTGTRYAMEEGEAVSTFHLTQGIVRFETDRTGPQSLIVQVGDITIEDIGTVFTVEALTANRVRVFVETGRVLVRWPSGQAEVSANNEGEFPPLPEMNSNANDRAQSPPPLPLTKSDNWRNLAKQGNYSAALLLIEADENRVRNRVEDLLLAADVMRFCNKSASAVRFLERVLRDFPDDTRAPLAAFSLGRVYLDELHQPRKSASAFALAKRNAGPLSEEAFAREVEAWYRAKDTEAARQAAKQYLEKYPEGERRAAVRSFGKVEIDP